jgi:FixJ family two-component response regulator
VNTSKVVTVIHPDARARVLLRSVLQAQGRTVATDHSCTDLLSDHSGIDPAVILMDRSLLAREGLDVLSLLCRKWKESQVVFLPEGLEAADDGSVVIVQLLRHVERLLAMRTTGELLAV